MFFVCLQHWKAGKVHGNISFISLGSRCFSSLMNYTFWRWLGKQERKEIMILQRFQNVDCLNVAVLPQHALYIFILEHPMVQSNRPTMELPKIAGGPLIQNTVTANPLLIRQLN